MRPFLYDQAASARDAARAAGGEPAAAFIAGGTTLLDLMKLDVLRPERLIDITGIGEDGIESTAQGLRLGGMARMADVAAHEEVRRDYPVIAEALDLAASQQLRNMARLGGNLLQRTRCPYFRDPSWSACNRRVPGSGCAALEGVNRQHAVLGTSDACIATYPGDLAQALVALDATLDIVGPDGARTMPVAELHRLPDARPEVETTLAPGEIITAIDVPAGPWTRRSLYLKIRDRESYAFALASAAVALDIADGVVREARIGLGGVATIPWRARAAEAELKGRPLDEASAGSAAEAAFASARPRRHNAFKVELGRRTLVRALLQAATMEA
ncbi:FAD binding domain-containing protein [Inquilinus limosus]|uniref:FAD-binding molybdopterin dehydrogenase n=1 Tax=Inquilinus limosus MP06 TaxID=1398085 RepID=A0A0A0D8F3_9PROT|nr:xanthine dehydrogenase family protein subunit M [Inquilinus limosus]KGM34414.1 FAD-binding molybdopterin dehydrogenase [Inquilinus limosus MP06]